ncbi:MAG: hypothetical protein HY907_15175 [Deltaproteobacteria bacterium]|nr:hypothetical protein [Deltaproteobacteria bacterium]
MAGHPAAQRALYLQAVGQVRRFARTLGLRCGDIPEVAHEVAAQALLDLPGFAFRSGFASWLYSIARHQQIRRRRKRQASPVDVGSERPAGSAAADCPETVSLAAEALCEAVRAILSLPARRGFALLAVRVLGAPGASVAAVLGCTANALRQLVHNAAAQADRLVGSAEGPPRHARCEDCRGPLAGAGRGAPPLACPMRWFLGMTGGSDDLAACWERYREFHGAASCGRIPSHPA